MLMPDSVPPFSNCGAPLNGQCRAPNRETTIDSGGGLMDASLLFLHFGPPYVWLRIGFPRFLLLVHLPERQQRKRERKKKKNKGSSLTERELIIINPARALLSGPDPIDDDHASIRHFDSLFVSSQFTKRRLPTSLSLALWERHSARRKWPLSIRGEWCTWESIASAFSATIRRAPAAPASAAYLSIDLIHFPLKKKGKKEKRDE